MTATIRYFVTPGRSCFFKFEDGKRPQARVQTSRRWSPSVAFRSLQDFLDDEDPYVELNAEEAEPQF
jgi:hypothetical protein